MTDKEGSITQSKKRKIDPEEITRLIKIEESEYREDITKAERFIGQVFYMFKHSNNGGGLGSFVVECVDTVDDELQDVTEEEIDEAFDKMIGNYLKLDQPKE